MKSPIVRKNFNHSHALALVEFALKHPHHPHHGARTLRRFLNDLISSTEMVFDYHVSGERKLVAVLVDNIRNPSNSANLEIIGYEACDLAQELIEQLLREAKTSLPKLRDGIEIGINAKSVVTESALRTNRFESHYMTFEMWLDDLKSAEEIKPPEGYSWTKLTDASFCEYYEVLQAAFAKNLETSLPPLEEMKRGFQTSRFPPTLLSNDENIVGFVSLQTEVLNDKTVGEVHMIGLHPSFRKMGLGDVLLARGLSELLKLGAQSSKLTVAADNASALKLYKKFGFAVKNQDICLRWKRNSDGNR